jgi:hypothetical protein
VHQKEEEQTPISLASCKQSSVVEDMAEEMAEEMVEEMVEEMAEEMVEESVQRHRWRSLTPTTPASYKHSSGGMMGWRGWVFSDLTLRLQDRCKQSSAGMMVTACREPTLRLHGN